MDLLISEVPWTFTIHIVSGEIRSEFVLINNDWNKTIQSLIIIIIMKYSQFSLANIEQLSTFVF